MTLLQLVVGSMVLAVVAVLVFTWCLLRAASSAERTCSEPMGLPDDAVLRGRLIASQQRFRRQADWSKPAVKGVKGDTA